MEKKEGAVGAGGLAWMVGEAATLGRASSINGGLARAEAVDSVGNGHRPPVERISWVPQRDPVAGVLEDEAHSSSSLGWP